MKANMAPCWDWDSRQAQNGAEARSKASNHLAALTSCSNNSSEMHLGMGEALAEVRGLRDGQLRWHAIRQGMGIDIISDGSEG